MPGTCSLAYQSRHACLYGQFSVHLPIGQNMGTAQKGCMPELRQLAGDLNPDLHASLPPSAMLKPTMH